MAGLTGWMILLRFTMVITVVVTSELENRKWGDPKNCSIYYVFQKHTCDSGLAFNCTTQKCDKRAEVDCTCNDEYSAQEDEPYWSWSSSSEESKSSSCSCSEDDSKTSDGYSKYDKGSSSPEHYNGSGYGGYDKGDNGSGYGGYDKGDNGSGSRGHDKGNNGSGSRGHGEGGNGSGSRGNGEGDNGLGSGGYGKGHGNDSSKGSGGYDTDSFNKGDSSHEDGPHEHHSHSQDGGYDTGHGSAEGNNKEQGIQKVDSILQMFKNKLAMEILTKGKIVIMMDITTKNIYYELQLKVLSFFIEMLNRVHGSIAVITCSVTANLLIKPGYHTTSTIISIVKGIKQYGSAVNYTAAIKVYKQVQQDADANILWLIGSESSNEVPSEITQMKSMVILCVALGNQRSTKWTRMCSRDKYGKPLCFQVKDASVIEIAHKYISLKKSLARLPFGISESNEERGKILGIF